MTRMIVARILIVMGLSGFAACWIMLMHRIHSMTDCVVTIRLNGVTHRVRNVAASRDIVIDVFSQNSVWVKPPNAVDVDVILQGGEHGVGIMAAETRREAR